MLSNTKSKKGFTIIEVVLVLAIAGLIFLMVFIAFPALQRAQHDRQRNQDFADLYSNVNNYLTNLNGKIPGTTVDLDETKFINSTGNNPDGFPYVIKIARPSDSISVGGVITDYNNLDDVTISAGNASGDESATLAEPVYVVFYSKCVVDEATGKTTLVKTKNKKDFSVWGKLESTESRYCQSSNSDKDTSTSSDVE